MRHTLLSLPGADSYFIILALHFFRPSPYVNVSYGLIFLKIAEVGNKASKLVLPYPDCIIEGFAEAKIVLSPQTRTCKTALYPLRTDRYATSAYKNCQTGTGIHNPIFHPAIHGRPKRLPDKFISLYNTITSPRSPRRRNTAATVRIA